MKKNIAPISLATISFALFIAIWSINKAQPNSNNIKEMDRIVIPAHLQIVLAAGDPFLAANFEAIRAASTWSGNSSIDALFRLRINTIVAQLNPCHEDNYYHTNALLSWGDSPTEGSNILKKAMECRHWDDIPAFFYGFNRYYFFNDSVEAQRAILVAAKRSEKKNAVYNKLAIMIQAGTLSNNDAALAFLNDQKNQSQDSKLRAMLDTRINRLEGLILLEKAQRTYESKFKKHLVNPYDLLSTGILVDIPIDPLGIGYEFENGQFQFKKLQFN